MTDHRPITEVIQSRFSCRQYLAEAIPPEKQRTLRASVMTITAGPFGTPLRFELIAAEDQDRQALRGLGTYGFIKGASAFMVGVMCPGPQNVEDYGYRLEQLVLAATDLGIGTCWLGGTFTKSNFARKIAASGEERLPAVIAMGLIADEAQARQTILRQSVGSETRLPWERLFFDSQFGAPLIREEAGGYALPLEMVRLGPSASNKQPWRVVQAGRAFHFYMRRTPGYRSVLSKMAGVEDMQRLDLGIALCHFESTARELGLDGHWLMKEPAIQKPDDLTEYCMSWACAAQ